MSARGALALSAVALLCGCAGVRVSVHPLPVLCPYAIVLGQGPREEGRIERELLSVARSMHPHVLALSEDGLHYLGSTYGHVNSGLPIGGAPRERTVFGVCYRLAPVCLGFVTDEEDTVVSVRNALVLGPVWLRPGEGPRRARTGVFANGELHIDPAQRLRFEGEARGAVGHTNPSGSL